MLAYILAIAVGFGSFAVYMAAFFFPEVHRKNDFFWSGVGFFYALILWVCAGRLTGAVLLGQIASVALLGWFALQTLYLRRVVTPASQQTPVPAKLQEQVSSLLAVKADEPRVTPTPTINPINQDTAPPLAVQPPAESVAVEPTPETVETEPETEPEVPLPSEIPSEIPEPIAEVPPPTETLSTSETEIKSEQEPLSEKPEPEPISATEIEFEDELDEVTEEKIETTPQPQTPSTPAPQPKRLSRIFRSITGLFNRQKNKPYPAVSPVETPAENQPKTVSETAIEAPTVEPETEGTPTLETVVAQEDVTPKTEEQPETSAVAETKAIDITEIESSPILEKPSEGEVEEITVTVEPDISSVNSFEQTASTSEEKEENATTISADYSKEIISEPVEQKASPEAETSAETEPSPSEENPALKRPNPPNPELKQASEKQKSSTDSDK